MTTTTCHCCKEDRGDIGVFDPILGDICDECAEGVRISKPYLDKNGIIGIFRGECGDNKRTAN